MHTRTSAISPQSPPSQTNTQRTQHNTHNTTHTQHNTNKHNTLSPPQDALEYGLIDEIIAPDAGKAAAAEQYWLRSGRAESEGRLEQWKEYIDTQVGGRAGSDCF
jgi:hypothetical protein